MCTVFPVGVACVERGVVVEAGKNYSGQSDGAAHRVRIAREALNCTVRPALGGVTYSGQSGGAALRVRIAIERPSTVQSDLRWVE